MEFGQLRLFDGLSDLAGLPIMGHSVVELSDDKRVLVENHCGVVHYGKTKICVKMNYGLLTICGEKMELAQMSKEQLVIVGKIESIMLARRENK